MAYSNTIPGPNDAISVSQGQILANFQALAPCVGGIFANQLANISTGPTDIALFNKVVGGSQILCIRDTNNGGIFPISDWLASPAGYTFFPSGLIMKFGNAVTSATGTTTVNYDASYPFTAVYTTTITPFANAGLPFGASLYYYINQAYATPNTGFQLIHYPGVFNIYYMTVGLVNPIP